MEHRRIQPRLRNIKRMPAWSSLHPKLKAVILREANRFNCSPSFVIATALEQFFKMELQEKYYEVEKKRK